MPADKDFKRLVRARMGRTGESYTTARSHLRPDGDPGRPDRFPGPGLPHLMNNPEVSWLSTSPADARANEIEPEQS